MVDDRRVLIDIIQFLILLFQQLLSDSHLLHFTHEMLLTLLYFLQILRLLQIMLILSVFDDKFVLEILVLDSFKLYHILIFPLHFLDNFQGSLRLLVFYRRFPRQSLFGEFFRFLLSFSVQLGLVFLVLAVLQSQFLFLLELFVGNKLLILNILRIPSLLFLQG